MVKRIVVGAHYGLGDWMAQRVTAVVMVLYSLIFAVQALMLSGMNYEAWRDMFSGGFMRFATFLFFVAVFYHAWVGVRNIFMDYIKPNGVRFALHAIVIVLLIGYAGWAARILWRL